MRFVQQAQLRSQAYQLTDAGTRESQLDERKQRLTSLQKFGLWRLRFRQSLLFSTHFTKTKGSSACRVGVHIIIKVMICANPFNFQIFKNGQLTGYIDGSDVKLTSWMRFIRCARRKKEQNLFAFQYLGRIFYRAFKDILPGEEMLVWYDEKYPQYLGIPWTIFDLAAAVPPGRWSPWLPFFVLFCVI